MIFLPVGTNYTIPILVKCIYILSTCEESSFKVTNLHNRNNFKISKLKNNSNRYEKFFLFIELILNIK